MTTWYHRKALLFVANVKYAVQLSAENVFIIKKKQPNY